MKKLSKAIVATGHPLVSGAAVEILQKGGNAFDAAVGAGFAGAVAEQTLTSLGGGGFLLARVSNFSSCLLKTKYWNTVTTCIICNNLICC